MDEQILQQEKSVLKSIISQLEAAKSTLEEKLNTLGKDNLIKLKDLRENPETSGLDFFMFLEQLHDNNRSFNVIDKYKKLDEFNYLLDDPYFARLDLFDNNTGNTDFIYVGKFGYTEEKPVITDWRAKIASVYYRYRYPQKDVKYDTPEGLQIRDLLLKRTFEIDKGSLTKYYNNDLQLDETELIAEKIEKRTGGVLEDIIETIQNSQLDIIEADPRQTCIVQGCVGSGKSTVAIHKLSHIFFNHTDIIHPERSLLLAKNQILVGYLSTLFPKLGIFDINYKTLNDLIVNIIFRENLKISVSLESNTDSSRVEVADIMNMQKEIDAIHISCEKEIESLFHDVEYSAFGGFKYSKNNTPYENLTEAIEELEEELVLQKEGIEANPKSLKAELNKSNIKTIRTIITGLKKIRLKLVGNLFAEVFSKRGVIIDKNLDYIDTLIYIYFYLEIIGLRKFQQYEYCVIDEGQDFSPLEYAVLGKLIIYGRLCILGDLNQAYDYHSIKSWSDIKKVISGANNANEFLLDTNYRSTKPIIELANLVLSPYTNKYLPKSINRKGPDPVINSFLNKEQSTKYIFDSLKRDVLHMDKSVGIICFYSERLEQIKQFLFSQIGDQNKIVILDPHTKISYIPKGVYLSSFNNCKGLEFSKAYILDLNLENITNFEEAKKAFVAITRAMNELEVIWVKDS